MRQRPGRGPPPLRMNRCLLERMSSRTSLEPFTFRQVSNLYGTRQAGAAGLFTFFRTIESGQDPVVMMGGREMVMLGSNNYLGLTSHPKIKERAMRPSGSTAPAAQGAAS